MNVHSAFSNYADTASQIGRRSSDLEKAAKTVGHNHQKALNEFLAIAKQEDPNPGDLAAAEQKFKRMDRALESLSRVMEYMHQVYMKLIQALRVN